MILGKFRKTRKCGAFLTHAISYTIHVLCKYQEVGQLSEMINPILHWGSRWNSCPNPTLTGWWFISMKSSVGKRTILANEWRIQPCWAQDLQRNATEKIRRPPLKRGCLEEMLRSHPDLSPVPPAAALPAFTPWHLRAMAGSFAGQGILKNCYPGRVRIGNGCIQYMWA